MGTLYKLDHTGHGLATWNDKESAAAAEKLFNELLTSSRYTAAVKTYPGTDKPAEQLRAFDEEAEHIVMLPNFVGG